MYGKIKAHLSDELAQIEQNGVNLIELGDKLQQEGLQSFIEAFDKLIELVK